MLAQISQLQHGDNRCALRVGELLQVGEVAADLIGRVFDRRRNEHRLLNHLQSGIPFHNRFTNVSLWRHFDPVS